MLFSVHLHGWKIAFNSHNYTSARTENIILDAAACYCRFPVTHDVYLDNMMRVVWNNELVQYFFCNVLAFRCF